MRFLGFACFLGYLLVFSGYLLVFLVFKIYFFELQ
jgi:hypothetical protein